MQQLISSLATDVYDKDIHTGVACLLSTPIEMGKKNNNKHMNMTAWKDKIIWQIC